MTTPYRKNLQKVIALMERIRAIMAERAAQARALIEAYSNPVVVIVVKDDPAPAESAAEAPAPAKAAV